MVTLGFGFIACLECSQRKIIVYIFIIASAIIKRLDLNVLAVKCFMNWISMLNPIDWWKQWRDKVACDEAYNNAIESIRLQQSVKDLNAYKSGLVVPRHHYHYWAQECHEKHLKREKRKEYITKYLNRCRQRGKERGVLGGR